MPNGAYALDDLPPVLAIFPLSRALLLPGGRLPLNIFEPRYRDMVGDAMSSSRLIGMVQPRQGHDGGEKPGVFDVGCAGRIVEYKETDDGRFLIVLAGISRFRIDQELDVTTRYRQARPDWASYAADLTRPSGEIEGPSREHLLSALKAYLATARIEANWKAIETSPTRELVTSLAMICPFAVSEKQALLEARDEAARAAMIITLFDMAVPGEPDDTQQPRH